MLPITVDSAALLDNPAGWRTGLG